MRPVRERPWAFAVSIKPFGPRSCGNACTASFVQNSSGGDVRAEGATRRCRCHRDILSPDLGRWFITWRWYKRHSSIAASGTGGSADLARFIAISVRRVTESISHSTLATNSWPSPAATRTISLHLCWIAPLDVACRNSPAASTNRILISWPIAFSSSCRASINWIHSDSVCDLLPAA